MAATQHTSQTWVHPDLHEDRHDFSLVLGGPLFQLLRKAHLEGDHLELLRQRMLSSPGAHGCHCSSFQYSAHRMGTWVGSPSFMTWRCTFDSS
jgi:hypothetical protein